MLRSILHFSHSRAKTHRHTFSSIFLVMAVIAVLYANFDPMPVGASYTGKTASLAELQSSGVVYAKPKSAASETGSTNKSSTDANTQSALNSKTALMMNMMFIEKGIEKLKQVPDYTATFFKEESVVATKPPQSQIINLKLRHAPLSIYMKWLAGDEGRELLYVDGQNKGKMLVKIGGAKGRLVPCVKIDPRGALAMQQSRHPVTDVGLLKLAQKILKNRTEEFIAGKSDQIACQLLEDQSFDGRPCWVFILEFQNAEVVKPYRKSIQFIDKEYLLPVCIKNYGWPQNDQNSDDELALDKVTMIEHYSYSNVRMQAQLAEADFDRYNESYRLRR